MTIPTQLCLHGFIDAVPKSNSDGSGQAEVHAGACIEQWRREVIGDLIELDVHFFEPVTFGRRAERTYDGFRMGAPFVAASGYVNELERQSGEHAIPLRGVHRPPDRPQQPQLRARPPATRLAQPAARCHALFVGV